MAKSVVRPHVPEEELHAYCDGELSPAQRVEIAEHLLACLICRSQHAEVEEMRARTSSLLAVAAPRTIRRPALPAEAPVRYQLRWSRVGAIAAAAIIGIGSWMLVRPNSGATQFASAIGVPVPTHAAAEANPVVASSWQASTLGVAITDGEAVRLPLPVTEVRMHDNGNGVAPTFMLRQRLADGRSVWVFEGPAPAMVQVDGALRGTGSPLSSSTRTVASAAGDEATAQRSLTVTGQLPPDSLNALLAKARN